MKDRFTTGLLLLVAVVGGVLAMVVVARWQPGKTQAPEAETVTMAEAVPEPGVPSAAKPRATQAAPDETLSSPPELLEAPEESAPRLGADDAETGVDEPPPVDSTEATGRRPVERQDRTDTARSRRERETVEPEPDRSREGSSGATSGTFGRPSNKPGAAQSEKGRAVTGSSAAMFVSPAQGETRSAPRSRATEPASEPQPGTDDSTDVETEPAVEETPDSQGDLPYEDDPEDAGQQEQAQEQEQDPAEDAEPDAPPPVVRMIPERFEYLVDERVTVAVEISSGTDVGHVPFYVEFDPRVLQFERGEEGPFLGLDGVGTMFIATLSGGGDSVIVGLSRLGRNPGIDGAGRLCLLHFVAVSPGTSALRFSRENVKDSTNSIVGNAIFESSAVTVR